MAHQKRAPSIDMTSTGLHNVSPAPTYSSTFQSEDVSISPLQAYFAATPRNGVSNNPYYQTAATKEPPSSMSRPRDRAPLRDEEDAEVRPDYQDPNHPHYAGSTGPKFPSAFSARSQALRKRVWIPFALFALCFLIALWFSSIYAGARLFNKFRPLSAPTVQETNVYINGEVFRGGVSVSIFTATATPTIGTTSTRIISATPTPSSTVQAPGSKPDVPPDTPDPGKDLDAISKKPEKRLEPAPTGFMTVARRIS
jgi:hypothetical protein